MNRTNYNPPRARTSSGDRKKAERNRNIMKIPTTQEIKANLVLVAFYMMENCWNNYSKAADLGNEEAMVVLGQKALEAEKYYDELAKRHGYPEADDLECECNGLEAQACRACRLYNYKRQAQGLEVIPFMGGQS